MNVMRLFLSLFFVILTVFPAFAAAGPWQDGENAAVRLIAATEAVGGLGQIEAGLQVRLRPGWHTYWRVPGDTGLPPSFSWDLSANVDAAEVAWPAPHRIQAFGFENYGYEGEVVFPVTVTPVAATQPVDLMLDLTLLVCEEVCIPENFSIRLSLPAGPAKAGDEAVLIHNAWKEVPIKGGTEFLSFGPAWVEGDTVTVEARTKGGFSDMPDVFLETADFLSFGPPSYVFSKDRTAARISLALNSMLPEGTLSAYAETKGITATLVSGRDAIEAPLVFGPPPAATASAGLLSFEVMGVVFLALLGGLILNLMPCVLPVLSLKLLSVVSHGGSVKGKVRAGFISAAAGIVFSFLVLAFALIVLKNAGGAVGWGIQFQHPVFLTFMILLLMLFAYSLWGLFEIPVPGFLASTTPKMHDHEPTLAGHFVTGAFATLLATPCSAPFVGTALGFALSRGPAEILLIFTALGLGLALPYLSVAAFPGVAKYLPRPGHWMVSLKKFLGLALAATAVWLLFVIGAQIGVYPAVLIAVSMLGIGHLFWHRKALDTVTMRKMNAVALGGLVAAAFVIAVVSQMAAPAKTANTGFWVPFDQAAIPRLVDSGYVVFVDVTADWCLTCKANKKFVLDSKEVAAALTGDKIVAMQADWTRPDAEIAAYLKFHGRYGIPFNIVYGPSVREGISLSELLSKDEVLNALRKAQ